MLLSNIVSQEEQSSWKMFKNILEVQREEQEQQKQALAVEGARAVTSTFHSKAANRDLGLGLLSERKHSAEEKTATAHTDQRPALPTQQPAPPLPLRGKSAVRNTPKTPLFSAVTPRDSNFEIYTPLD